MQNSPLNKMLNNKIVEGDIEEVIRELGKKIFLKFVMKKRVNELTGVKEIARRGLF